MSLDYNYKNVKNSDEVMFENDYMRPVSEAIIFRTMAVDMGEITEENAEEFYKRCKVFSAIHGEPLVKTDKEGNIVSFDITLEDVRNHIGLTTNVVELDWFDWFRKLGGNKPRYM
jgi:hypothetical protein